MNRVTVEPQQDGTQVWSNIDEQTGAEIRYVFTPKALLSPGDRLEDTEDFRRRADGRGLEKVTSAGQGVINAAFINALPSGSFVRARPGPARPGGGNRVLAPMTGDPLAEEPSPVTFRSAVASIAPAPVVPKAAARARRRK